jgi:uncharacterized protein
MNTVSDLDELLRRMNPILHSGVFVFCLLPPELPAADVAAVGWVREPEGVTVILEEHAAETLGLTATFRAAWITLSVPSDLEAVGFTAAVSRALADAGIACNVVAAIHHDHLFVPVERGQDALNALRLLQQSNPKAKP